MFKFDISFIKIVGRVLASFVCLLFWGAQAYAIRGPVYSLNLDFNNPESGKYFRSPAGHFKYAGGVVFRGNAVFFDAKEKPVPIEMITLSYLEPSDKAYLVYNNAQYEIPLDNEYLCPLAKFVRRDQYIVYTIPPVESKDYFDQSGLVKVGYMSYAAKEFAVSKEIVQFLDWIDLYSMVTPLEKKLEEKLLESVNNLEYSSKTYEAKAVGVESYVNADFNIKYGVYLEGGKADSSGLPLRYYWGVDEEGQGFVKEIRTFSMPKESGSPQAAAIELFQYAAVMRKFMLSRPVNFAKFIENVCSNDV